MKSETHVVVPDRVLPRLNIFSFPLYIVKLKEEIIEKQHIIDGLQKDLQNNDNLKHQDVEALENQVKILEDEISNKNELINDFTEKLEIAEQEKNQLNDKLAALRNKAKEYLKKAKVSIINFTENHNINKKIIYHFFREM